MSLQQQETFWHKGKKYTRLHEQHYEQWVVGIDLGQRVDHTVLCALRHTRIPVINKWDTNERTGILRQRVEELFAVRGLHRLPLGMDWRDQADRIRQLMLGPPLNGQADLCLDDSNVGGPIGDDLVAHGQLNPVRVTLSGTATEVVRKGYRKYTLPKILLVSNLDVRLSSCELQFDDDLSSAEVAKDEFANFQRRVTAASHFTFEARGSKHDDIVMAVGLALWWAIQKRKNNLGRPGTVIGLI
jgi:hypothetical protein